MNGMQTVRNLLAPARLRPRPAAARARASAMPDLPRRPVTALDGNSTLTDLAWQGLIVPLAAFGQAPEEAA